jgi:hypothetical protein
VVGAVTSLTGGDCELELVVWDGKKLGPGIELSNFVYKANGFRPLGSPFCENLLILIDT